LTLRNQEEKLDSYSVSRFNNLQGQFPAIYLTSCDGRHTPGNVLGIFEYMNCFEKKGILFFTQTLRPRIPRRRNNRLLSTILMT